MPPKRPIRNVFGNDDDDPSANDETQNGTPPKRSRPDSRSTTIHRVGVPPAVTQHAQAAQRNGRGGGGGTGEDTSIQAQIAAAKARAQALTSALPNKGSAPAGGTSVPAAMPTTSIFAPASRRSAVNGRSAASAVPSPVTAGTSSSPTARLPVAGAGSGSIQAQLEAARARVAALNHKNKMPTATTTGSRSAPQSSSTSTAASTTTSFSSSAASASSTKAPTGIHPLLLSSDLPYKPKSAEANLKTLSSTYVKGRTNVAPESNPYLQASRELATDTSTQEGPKQRSMHRGFQFHKPGRHVREAEELRHEQQMEDLKRRIEESARKAGLQDELGGDEKRLLQPAPPDVEWWDVNLLSSPSYDGVPDLTPVAEMLTRAQEADSPMILFGETTPIDQYIQHPVPIPAPSDNVAVQPRGLMLTKREQRKLRRQRRAAEQQDKRDRIKMGLLPPEPPKVKLSNLMRVLTSEAVSDPTKIEARVRREIAARKEAHERMNAENRLTDEQRHEKVEKKKQADEEKGLFCQVYRVQHLVSPRHKFKVQRNALDHALTGVTIFHPNMALVVVEGSAKALKAYKRLMTVRIDWTDPGQPKNASEDEETHEEPSANNTPLTGFRHLTTSTDDVDWSSNSCQLIFEGPIRQRNWGGRGFRAKAAPTDQAARDTLGEQMQGYWDVAKRAVQSQADAF
ncbi:hypothetical protein EX895_001399 [Sporisorium graminicola]|uniref:Uncharacterized protein n=1 Tax=Sporisorium graminicola TaxID=280036 RepID=A0A4U7KXQ3_9BASI|nr:hypothetical protein EX895_001399 [Sporisorium graminicola]TKY89614.1 hypothetical protein EX895_001399 [Sporisorium graminicola]